MLSFITLELILECMYVCMYREEEKNNLKKRWENWHNCSSSSRSSSSSSSSSLLLIPFPWLQHFWRKAVKQEVSNRDGVKDLKYLKRWATIRYWIPWYSLCFNNLAIVLVRSESNYQVATYVANEDISQTVFLSEHWSFTKFKLSK